MIWIFVIAYLGLASARINVEPEYLDALRAAGKNAEFARLLGIEDVSLVQPNNEERAEDVRGKSVSPLGDILLTQEQNEQARQGIRFDNHPTYRWPSGRIPYVILGRDFTAQQIRAIETWISEFNSRVDNVQIARRSNWQPERDYVAVFSGDGCFSALGRVGGQQALSLQSQGCLTSGTVQHEFMHAAGFTHEHNRADRDSYIRLIPENIPEEWQTQYEKASENDFGTRGPYDYYSVMHYRVQAPESSLPAFEVLRDDVEEILIGQEIGLTKIDIAKVNDLYS